MLHISPVARLIVALVTLLMWDAATLLAPLIPLTVCAKAAAAPQALLRHDAHAAVCHCADCAGGPKCCCLHGRTAVEQATLRAICDRGAVPKGQTVPAALKQILPAPPALTCALLVSLRRIAPVSCDRRAASHVPDPLRLPPQLVTA